VMSGIGRVLEAVTAHLGCDRAIIATLDSSPSALSGFAWSGVGIGDLRSPVCRISIPLRGQLDIGAPIRVSVVFQCHLQPTSVTGILDCASDSAGDHCRSRRSNQCVHTFL
jgi:hypothetical protein